MVDSGVPDAVHAVASGFFAAQGGTMIELDDLTVKLPGFAVQNVSLRVAPGEFFALLGPTGSGKTVILESIAGLVHVTGGRIRLAARDITRYPPERRRIGIVYQDYALFPHLTVMENICYGLRYFDLDMQQARQRIDHLVDMLGLQAIVHRRPLHLSGGEKQRACLARALSINPSVLLLDEPLSALDPNFREDIRRVLKQLHGELGITFMMVTHDFSEALYLADRVGVIRNGRMEQVGSTEDVFLRPANPFVAEFVGMKNLFAAEVSDRKVAFGGLNCPMPGPVSCDQGILALRPEDIVLQHEDSFDGEYVRFSGVIEQIVPAGLWHEISVRCRDACFKTVMDRKTLMAQRYNEGDAVFLGFRTESVRVF
jgi:molybdate/tungstate transport system ATP-binding protein